MNEIMNRRRTMMGSGSAIGVKTATGSFIAGDVSNQILSHNLGTTKIFGMIWLEPNENNEVITVRGYQLIFSTFISLQKMDELFTGTTLVSDYTSSETKTAEYPESGYNIGGGRRLKSNWSNTAAGWNAAVGVTDFVAIAVDDNSLQLRYVGGTGPYFSAGVRYYWQCWALE